MFTITIRKFPTRYALEASSQHRLLLSASQPLSVYDWCREHLYELEQQLRQEEAMEEAILGA